VARLRQDATPVEMLRARVTYSNTGYPAKLRDVQEAYGPSVAPAPDDGWFWVGATPRSAEDIRRRGLLVRGEITTTFIPPDGGGESDVLAYGSPEWVELMLAETREQDGEQARGGYYYADAPEEFGHPSASRLGGPLRKVIVFRLKRVEATW
jgi:hypothetical protein